MGAGAKSLSDVYESEARRVSDLARAETRPRGPRPRRDAIEDLGLADHWIDFADPADETARALSFANRGLARGAKVVALLPAGDIDAYRARARQQGHSKALDEGRFSFFPMDAQMETLRSAGAAAVFILAVQGILRGIGAAEASETWIISKVASALLTSPPARFDMALRVESAWDLLLQSLPISVYCPLPVGIPANVPFATSLVERHTWAALGDFAIATGPHPGSPSREDSAAGPPPRRSTRTIR